MHGDDPANGYAFSLDAQLSRQVLGTKGRIKLNYSIMMMSKKVNFELRLYFLQQVNQVLKVEVVAIISDQLFRESSLQKVRHLVRKDEA